MAVGSTTIRYGSAVLVNVTTRSFAQESVYDDSGTDLLYFKYTIRVVGYINNLTSQAGFGFLPVTSGVGPDGTPSAADQLAQIHYLFQTRQTFTMTVGSFVMLTAQPATVLGSKYISGFDCNNGPRAKVVSVDRIASDTVFRVEAEFEVAQVQCDPQMGTSNNSGVLNNRWSCTDDISQDWYTTRTFTGRLRCSSSQVNPNSFRSLVIPPLQQGMARDSISMRVTEDGLALEYTVVDREVAFSAPAPATRWALTVTERRSSDDICWFTDVDVTLWGDRNVDKKRLIAIAAAVADAKFSGGIANAANFLVDSIQISDQYDGQNNSIHLMATARRLDNNGPAIMGMQAQWLGSPINAADLAAVVNGYDSRNSRGMRQGETLQSAGPIPVAGAFACFLQSPCSTQHAIALSGTTATTEIPAQASLPQLSATVVSELPDDGTLQAVSATNSSNAYTYWKLNSRYSTNQVRAHCPIAKTASPTSSERDSSVAINLAAPMTRRIIRVDAERIAALPTLPQPVDSFVDENGIKNVLLRNDLVSSGPTRSPDNKQIFSVAGEIEYAMLSPITPTSTLRLGFNSWENQTPTYKMIFPEQEEA